MNPFHANPGRAQICFALALCLLAASLHAKTSRFGNGPPPPVADPVDDLYLQGNYAQTTGKYDLAISCWDRVLKLQPGDATAFYSRALAYDSKGDKEKALADIASAIQLAPKDPQAYELRASIYFKQAGTPAVGAPLDKALADYATALHLRLQGVDDPKAWLIKKAADAETPGQALAGWNEIITLAPKDSSAYVSRARLWDTSELVNFDKAFADLAEAIRIDPDNRDAYLVRAGIYTGNYEGKGPTDFTKAATDLTEVLRIAPDKNICIYRGTVYAKLGKIDKAAADFNAAIRLGAEKEGYSQLAALYLQAGQWDNEAAAYTELIRIDPNTGGYNYYRAETSYHKKDWAKAVADLGVAIPYYTGQHDGMAANAIQLRAGAYYHQRDWEKSLADFNRLADASPTDWQGRMGAAWIYATCPDEKFRDGAKAIRLASQLCEINHWGDHDDIDILAAAYAEAGKWDDAIATEQKAIDLAKTPRYNHDPAILKQLTGHLTLYQQKKPCREEREPLLYWR